MDAMARSHAAVETAIAVTAKWRPEPVKEERPTSVHAFLLGKGKLDGTGARLSFEDRWMVFSGVANCWVVFQRKTNRQKTKVLYSGNLDGALEFLERGPEKKTERGPFVLARGLAGG